VVRDNVVERDSYSYGPVSSSCSAIDWSGNQLADVSEDGVATNLEPLTCTG